MTTTFNPLYVDYLGGDHLAALMLSQIIYWYTPGRNGKAKITHYRNGNYWLVKSNKDWESELRLTRRQSQRCLSVLKQKGLIETEVLKFDGAPTVHIRCTLTAGNVLSVEQLGAFHCTVTNNALHSEGQSLYTKITTENTTESPALEKLSAKQQAEPLPVGGQEKNSGDVKNARMKKEEIMATVAEIVKQQQEKAKAVTPNTRAGLYYLWQKRMATLSGGFQKELTGKDKGQLAQFLTKAGDDASKALDFALQNWGKFCWEVKTKKGQTTSPDIPMPGYVLANYDVLLQLIAQKPVIHAIPDPTPKPKAAPKPVVQEVVEEGPSIAEMQAELEAFLNSKKKAK